MAADIQSGPLLSVQGLSKRFGRRLAVRDVGLEVAAGEVVGFVGPNGAGKTTTLRMLAGLVRPDGGQGRVLGHDLIHARRQISRRVGYMPQRLALYGELSVLDNLRFRADVYELPNAKGAVAEAMADFGLEDRAGQRADQLSGGWARRLQLAATLIHRPALVLLDEPTAGLDAESKLDVWRRIVALSWAGIGVVVNTHDLIEAEQCGRVALFSEGAVLTVDTPEAIAGSIAIDVLLVTGVEPARAGPAFAAMAGVVSAQPQGHRLKLIVLGEATAAVTALAKAQGGKITAAPKRLEDAALALSSGAAPARAA